MKIKDVVVIRLPLPTSSTAREHYRPWHLRRHLGALGQWLNRVLSQTPETSCPRCQSENVAAEDDEQVQAASHSWWLLATRYRCFRCGYAWDQRPLFPEDHLL